MDRLLLLLPLSAICGFSYGYFLLGRWRADLLLDGVNIFAGIAWKVLLQTGGMLGGVILFALAGFYPVRGTELLLSGCVAGLCVAIARNLHRRRTSAGARRLGLLGEDDLR